MAIQNMYQFKRGALSAYQKAQKNADTLYFLTDTKQIYLGEDLFTGVLETVKPDKGVAGKLYYVNNEVSYWDGAKYVAIAQDPTSIDEKITALKGKPSETEVADGATQNYVTLWEVEKAVKAVAADLDDKNVDAEGDDWVKATATDNKVTVAATQKTKDAIAAAETSIQSLTVNGVNATVSGDANAKSATVEIKAGDIEYKAAEGTADEEGYKAAISVKSALDTINGDATTEGSIKKAAADAVAKVVDGADEAFDTLKEIAEWIATEESAAEAADLVTRMSAAETAIGKHTVEVDGENKEVLYPVADQIDAAIDALEGEATGDNKGVSVKVTTSKGKVSGVTVTVDDTLVNALEVNGQTATVANNKATVEIKAGDIEYKANTAAEGEPSNAVSVSGAIKALEDLMGSDSVDDQIKEAIEALDTTADVKVATVDANGIVKLTAGIKEKDGIIAGIDEESITLAKVAATGEAEDVKLTGYAKNDAIVMVAAADSVKDAIGKLEARLCWQEINLEELD